MAARSPFTAFDPDASTPARTYDAFSGGTDNYEADRRAAAEIGRYVPAADLAADNSAFVIRAVTWAARRQVRDYIVLGHGLIPETGVHAAAREVLPDARVAYVDHDLDVADQVERILDREEDRGGLSMVCSEIRDPAAVLATLSLQGTIRLDRPVCVVAAIVLKLMAAADARDLAARYAGRLVPGSVIVISSVINRDPVSFAGARAAWGGGELYNHTREEVASFFSGLEVIPPGLVAARGWRGGMPDADVAPGAPAYVLGGVGRKG